MDDITEATENSFEYYGSVFKGIERLMDLSLVLGEASQEKIKANGIYFNGVFKYLNEFMTPFWIALNSFNATEREKLVRHPDPCGTSLCADQRPLEGSAQCPGEGAS
jgi:hypothetical protein